MGQSEHAIRGRRVGNIHDNKSEGWTDGQGSGARAVGIKGPGAPGRRCTQAYSFWRKRGGDGAICPYGSLQRAHAGVDGGGWGGAGGNDDEWRRMFRCPPPVSASPHSPTCTVHTQSLSLVTGGELGW